MNGLISFVSLLVVIGVIAWIAMHSGQLSGVDSPQKIQDTVVTPIDMARDAKRQIESHPTSLSQ